MTTAPATTHDRFLTVPQLIERWPVGRTMTYQLIKGAEFPKALVLLRDRNGQPRFMGHREVDIVAFEELHSHVVRAQSFSDELVSHCLGTTTVAYTHDQSFRTGADNTIPHSAAAPDYL